VARARGRLYGLLALAFSPTPGACLTAPRDRATELAAAPDALGDEALAAELARLRKALAGVDGQALETLHLDCFGHGVSKEHPPYEAEYGQAHVFQKAQTLADIAGFYRAFGLELAGDFHDRLDHLSVELEFMAFLCAKEAHALAGAHPPEKVALCRKAQGRFLGDHLGRWSFAFARRLEARAAGDLYRGLGVLLAVFVARELDRFGLERAEEPELAPTPPAAEAPGCGPPCVLVDPPALRERGGPP